MAACELAGDSRQLSNGLVLKELFGLQLQARLSGSGHDLYTENRVASQGKEVVMNAHLCKTQDLLPDGDKRLLHLRTRKPKGWLTVYTDLRSGQGFTIHFAVRQ